MGIVARLCGAAYPKPKSTIETQCNILYFSETVGSMGSELSLNRSHGARRKTELKDLFLWKYGKVDSISLPLPEITTWINPPRISQLFQGYHQGMHGADSLSTQANSLRSRVSPQCLRQSFLPSGHTREKPCFQGS
ncbi:PTPN13-like protein, Y-linked [Macaca thibetana thibetana]|uniref:PTPN13-like protein, Y-linked n=1 Tax=Macaca thibetana thibetana TaxID=257877 RepID=UPI0021BCF5FC|nr:PTPN13-like protein, Y-linked [Macaca thibetana thibetana]